MPDVLITCRPKWLPASLDDSTEPQRVVLAFRNWLQEAVAATMAKPHTERTFDADSVVVKFDQAEWANSDNYPDLHIVLSGVVTPLRVRNAEHIRNTLGGLIISWWDHYNDLPVPEGQEFEELKPRITLDLQWHHGAGAVLAYGGEQRSAEWAAS